MIEHERDGRFLRKMRAGSIIGLVYGTPLDEAINNAGVALAHMAKTDSAKALDASDLFRLLSKRLTDAFASPFIYDGGATPAIRARPLAERVADALRMKKYKTKRRIFPLKTF